MEGDKGLQYELGTKARAVSACLCHTESRSPRHPRRSGGCRSCRRTPEEGESYSFGRRRPGQGRGYDELLQENITTHRDGGLLEGGVSVCLLQAVVPGRGGAALALQGVS